MAFSLSVCSLQAVAMATYMYRSCNIFLTFQRSKSENDILLLKNFVTYVLALRIYPSSSFFLVFALTLHYYWSGKLYCYCNKAEFISIMNLAASVPIDDDDVGFEGLYRFVVYIHCVCLLVSDIVAKFYFDAN